MRSATDGFTPVARRRLALAMLWLVPALWSSTYVIARASVDAISPHLLASAHWVLALAIMLPLTWRQLLPRWPQWRSEWRRIYGALSAWIVIGEPPRWYHSVCAAVILPSIRLATRRAQTG